MYYRHFGLDGPPFRFAPSAAVLYLGSAHRECLAALQWALLHDECGFMLLIGETGTGKTTLLNAVLARKVPNLQLACVTNPRLSFEEIMRVVLPQLGVKPDARGKLELIQQLERVVASRPAGHRVAIAIDEAQDLSDETFEDLRLLANRVGDQAQDLQIVLMGHPELLERLSAHHLRQLRERISTKVTLLPLSAAESIAYIDCRLAAQGGSARVFETKALRHLIKTAAGIPRRLNVLCHNAMLLACSKNESTVTMAIAQEVVNDYQSILGPAPAKPARTVLPAISLRSMVPAKLVRAQSSDELPQASRREQPAIRKNEPVILTEESEVRPRRRPIYAAAACVAVVLAAGGILSIPTTQNWAKLINRAVPALANLVTPADAEVPSKPSAESKPVTQKNDSGASLAPALDYTAPIAPTSHSLPAAPAPAEAAPAPRRTTILIHPGDTFHDLATKYLGSKDRAGELIKANPQIRNPNILYVGQIVYLPSNLKNYHSRVVQ